MDEIRVGEAFIRGNELIIGAAFGYDLPENHNCDSQGCGQWHVIARLPIVGHDLCAIQEQILRREATQ